MRWALVLLGLVVALPGAPSRAQPAEPAIANPALDPAWIGLWVRLATSGNRSCRFEERRYFPFRSAPIVVTGQLRFTAERGLSLQYLTPERRLVVIDDQGVLMRDAAGRSQAVPADERSLGPLAALLPIMEFNLPQLVQAFTFRGQHEADRWTLTLVPRPGELARGLRWVRMTGDGSRLRKIEVNLSAHQRVEILLLTFREQVVFSAADLARYFR